MRDEVRADALLASLEQEHRGQAEGVFGRWPGVGKTYAMLQAVREQAREESTSLIGVVETRPPGDPGPARQARHPAAQDPPAPPAAAGGDGSRRPARPQTAIAVVDELAHSNAPGSRHEKRWQDVEELLNAGIDVYTTLNVQHLESLNDLVWQLTGVRVKGDPAGSGAAGPTVWCLIDLPPGAARPPWRARSMCPTRPRRPCNPSSPSTT